MNILTFVVIFLEISHSINRKRLRRSMPAIVEVGDFNDRTRPLQSGALELFRAPRRAQQDFQRVLKALSWDEVIAKVRLTNQNYMFNWTFEVKVCGNNQVNGSCKGDGIPSAVRCERTGALIRVKELMIMMKN